MRSSLLFTRSKTAFVQLGVMLIVLYFVSLYDYLLFHSLIEIMGAAIAFGIFMVIWNSRRFFIENHYFLFLSIAFLTIGTLKVIHALAYKGMGVFEFSRDNANIATQLWLATQYIFSLSLLIAPLFIKRKLNSRLVFLSYTIIFSLTILSIFTWKIFPESYQENYGLTPFKIYSEYIITLIFCLSLYFLYRNKDYFAKETFFMLFTSIGTLILSELCFTFYRNVYDVFNLIGHLLGIIAFYLSYMSMVELSLMKPYKILFKDLKDREKNLQFEKKRLDNILDNMVDGVYITNKECRIVYANPSLKKEFGEPQSNQKCYEFLHGRSEPCPWCKNQTVFSGETVRWEWTNRKTNKIYDIVDSPIITQEGINTKLEIFRDITERKEVEKAKDEFISMASHQLRTPLSSISLSSELLLRGIGGAVKGEQKEYLEEIYKSTKRMSSLISNLLNISRIEMGIFHMDMIPLDFSKIITNMIKEFNPLLNDKELTLEKNIENNIPVINFDENTLRIIIDNLLSNSIRYTPKGGKIHIEVKSINSKLLIKVSDTGCGIPENQREKIFNKSFRADNAKLITSQGAGIGLYMVKSIITKLSGQIWFESKINHGTTFYVTIPMN